MPALWGLATMGATHRIDGPRRSIQWNFRGTEVFGRQLSDLACVWDVRKNWVGVSQIILSISLLGNTLRSLKQDVERDGVISSVK